MRPLLSVLLTWVLAINSLPAKPKNVATPYASQAPAVQKPTVKQKALEIPTGTRIEIRLKTKKKLRGRLAEISNDALTLRTLEGGKIGERKIAFDDITSIKTLEGSKAGRTALYILAGVGVGLIILFVIALANYKS